MGELNWQVDEIHSAIEALDRLRVDGALDAAGAAKLVLLIEEVRELALHITPGKR